MGEKTARSRSLPRKPPTNSRTPYSARNSASGSGMASNNCSSQCGRRQRAVVEAGDADALIRPLQAVEHTHQPPGGAGQHVRPSECAPRHGAHGQLHGQYAAHAERVDGPPAGVDVALFPDSPVAGEQFRDRDKLGAMWGLPISSSPSTTKVMPQGKGPPCRARTAPTAARRAINSPLSSMAPGERAVAHCGLEGRRGPQFQRFRGLDVVVVVEEQGARRGAAETGHDDRVAVCGDLIDGELATPNMISTRPAQASTPSPVAETLGWAHNSTFRRCSRRGARAGRGRVQRLWGSWRGSFAGGHDAGRRQAARRAVPAHIVPRFGG